jgi:hypothetical protein
MTHGLIVRVTTDSDDGASLGFALYAVACPTPGQAVDAVRAIMPAGSRVKGAIGSVSAATLELLGLKPGEARRL